MTILRKMIAIFLMVSCGAGASAADVEDFYRGKTVSVVVGYGPGGGYDLYARLLARYLGNHIPGHPAVVVQNMPGAASLRAANYMFAGAPRDGTTIGTFDMNMPLIGFMGGNPNVQFEPRKFVWLGSLSNSQDDAFVLWARRNAAVRSSADLTRSDGPLLTVGTTAAGATDNDVGVLLRDVLGLRLKIVPGYPDSNAIGLGVENAELDGQLVGFLTSKIVHPNWAGKDSAMHVILQFARTTRHPDLPDVPMARELAKDDRTRRLIDVAEMPYQMARPYVAPPGTPDDRARALQAAFEATAADPAFIAEGRQMNLDMSPVMLKDALRAMDALASTPDEIFARLRALRDDSTK